MQQKLIRLPKDQIKWLEKEAEIYGSVAAAIRMAIRAAMERDNGNKKGVKHGKQN